MDQRPPLISVVIPAYNVQETLNVCLDALEQQTLPREHYEIIIVDDGSTDGTQETAANRDVVMIHQRHRGAAAARNAGVHRAQGEIIFFTDADCVPELNWIEAMAAPFSNEDVIGVSGRVCTHQGGLVPRFVQLEYDNRYENIARHVYIDFINTATGAYRREIFLENEGFCENLLGAEDAELSFRLASKGHKMVFAPEAIVYHSHPESILEYAQRKYHYGYWRMMVYQKHPYKVVADSRTPQTQKIQIGLLFLLIAAAIGGILWRGFVWLAGGLTASVFLTLLPFWWRAIRKDLEVGLLTPLLLLVATVSVGAGVIVSLTRKWIRRFKIAGRP
jgi:cellulose synthase/poly-beta-1,6-N-acetylglucosamine synthase-like glycosyltransferase